MLYNTNERYIAPTLIWDSLVLDMIPAERQELYTILGPDTIDRNSLLHEELLALSDILEDLREQNELRKVFNSLNCCISQFFGVE